MRNDKIEICQPTLNRIAKAFMKRLEDMQVSRRYFSQQTGITEYTCCQICAGRSMSICTLIEALNAAGLELVVKLKQ